MIMRTAQITKKRINEIIKEQRAILIDREAATMGNSIVAFRHLELTLNRNITNTLEFIERRKLANESFDDAMHRLNRYESLNSQIKDLINKASEQTINRIRVDQSWAVGQAQKNIKQLVSEQFGERNLTQSVITNWNNIPKDALNHLIGFASNGQPLGTLINQLPLRSANIVYAKLLEGVGLGKNPKIVARDAARMTQVPLNRLMTITRTEILRSYRESARRAFTENAFETGGVIKGWIWHSALDSRCCACCIALHGKEFKVEEKMANHPNCRCAMIPKTATWEELGFGSITETTPEIPEGENWFSKQSDHFQLNTLGPKKFKLYKNGKIKIEDLIYKRVDSVWGSMHVEATIAQALNNAAARDIITTTVTKPKNIKPFDLRKNYKNTTDVKNKKKIISDWIDENQSELKEMFSNGMKEPEMMHTVVFEGIPYHYPPNLRKQFEESIDGMLSIDKFPETLTKYTKNVFMTNQKCVWDEYFANLYNMPNASAEATGGSGNIVFYGGKPIYPYTMAHEMGHNLATGIYGSTTPTTESAFMKAITTKTKGKLEPPVSKYAGVALPEDFAESVRMYFQTKTHMKNAYPKRYKIINGILKGRIRG